MQPLSLVEIIPIILFIAQRDEEQDEETMNVSTNWVLQLLIVEPFNILFHIRENKKFESIKEKI